MKAQKRKKQVVVKKEEEPIVDGEAGRRALDLAIKIQNKILESFNEI